MTPDVKMQWPLGSHKGRHAHDLPVNYLLWFLSIDDLRKCHPGLALVALEVLRGKLHAPGRAEAALGIPLGARVPEPAMW